MKSYNSPEINIYKFETEDIMTGSSNPGGFTPGEDETDLIIPTSINDNIDITA